MSSVGSELSAWFWNPDIWLPPNVSWDTFKEEKVINSTVVIKPENFDLLEEDSKLNTVLNLPENCKPTAQFITDAYSMRSRILNYH